MRIPNNVPRALEGEEGLTRVAEGVTDTQTLQTPNRLKSQKAMPTCSYKLLKNTYRDASSNATVGKDKPLHKEQVTVTLHQGQWET